MLAYLGFLSALRISFSIAVLNLFGIRPLESEAVYMCGRFANIVLGRFSIMILLILLFPGALRDINVLLLI